MKRLQQRFREPIITPGGRKLVTLKDAGEYLQSLSKKKLHSTPAWASALRAVRLAIDNEGPIMIAEIAMHAALYPKDLNARPEPSERKKNVRKYKIIK